MVALLARLFLRERLTRAALLSLAVGLGGVVLLTAPSGADLTPPVRGVVLILLGVLCAALDTVVSRAFVLKADPLTISAASNASGLGVIGIVAVLGGHASWRFTGDASTLALAVASGIVMHGIATVLFNFALVRISASRAALMFPVISLVTALGGTLLLGDRMARAQVLGGAFIFASAILAAAGGQASITTAKEHRDDKALLPPVA